MLAHTCGPGFGAYRYSTGGHHHHAQVLPDRPLQQLRWRALHLHGQQEQAATHSCTSRHSLAKTGLLHWLSETLTTHSCSGNPESTVIIWQSSVLLGISCPDMHQAISAIGRDDDELMTRGRRQQGSKNRLYRCCKKAVGAHLAVAVRVFRGVPVVQPELLRVFGCLHERAQTGFWLSARGAQQPQQLPAFGR